METERKEKKLNRNPSFCLMMTDLLPESPVVRERPLRNMVLKRSQILHLKRNQCILQLLENPGDPRIYLHLLLGIDKTVCQNELSLSKTVSKFYSVNFLNYVINRIVLHCFNSCIEAFYVVLCC